MMSEATRKCIIVDDEPIAIRVIRGYLLQIGGFEIVAECRTATEAFQLLRSHSIDLIFLDIQMPKLTGLDFLKALQHRPKVILVTAYREYAIEGFDLDVVDYLLKPVSLERFMKAIDKFYQLTEGNTKAHTVASQIPASILVKSDRKTVKIVLDDILYIESYSDYIKIFTADETIITKERISHIEESLPGSFIRTHRSFVVNSAQIKSFTNEHVNVAGKEIPISRSYKEEVLSRFQSR
ncbi:LytTR family DNA-binding domain-containing protein [Imperialibacter sp.]|uniref:LytR/AlgR family response regulator transcription factor n=1 Tax=Imperialibacter sp. TaxID=2038411 RepID=UPI0032ED278F